MSRRISFAPGEFYHIYNRGNGGRFVFPEIMDKNRFQKLLFLCNSEKSLDMWELSKNNTEVYKTDRGETLVDIGAYSILYSHYHLLLHEKIQNGISKFMQKLGTAFSMYFNEKHKNSGSIFEGRFRAKHADRDPYLEYLFAYIHLNPVEHLEKNWKEDGLKDLQSATRYLQKYRHSSYIDYLKNFTREESALLTPQAFPSYFLSRTDVEDYHTIWLTQGPSQKEGWTFLLAQKALSGVFCFSAVSSILTTVLGIIKIDI